jgi:hypothetical protein
MTNSLNKFELSWYRFERLGRLPATRAVRYGYINKTKEHRDTLKDTLVF